MNSFNFNNIDDIKLEEERIHAEYKQKLAELKKIQKEKEKESSGQIFTKGLLPIYVLHILTSGATNGNDIAHKIAQRTNGLWLPSTGGIYPLLKKMEKEGFVTGVWDHPKKKFQKLYSLTPKGLDEYKKRKISLKAKIEESLKVFKIIYKDIYL